MVTLSLHVAPWVQEDEEYDGTFCHLIQDGVVRSPLSEIVAPKEDVSKLRFPLHPVQKIPVRFYFSLNPRSKNALLHFILKSFDLPYVS